MEWQFVDTVYTRAIVAFGFCTTEGNAMQEVLRESSDMVEVAIGEPPTKYYISLFERCGVKLAMFTSETALEGEAVWMPVPIPTIFEEIPELLQRVKGDLAEMGYILDQPAGRLQ